MKVHKIYKVNKPWGHELWISKKNNFFAFKEIFIKKGFKTSLKLHQHKQEINVCFSGSLWLYYNENGKLLNKDDTDNLIIKKTLINHACIINTEPYVIHRLEAKSDLFLYEASTHQLDDVIRIQDDTNRKNGKIKEEHK